jgi:ribosomal protein L11 methyltransferase
MLQRVLEADLRGLKVLDMGCGTAILAILALMHGAEQALGIEIEPHAADNARELAEVHELSDRLEVRTGDISALRPDEAFEVIYANIHRNVLLADMGRYALALKPGGQLHLSGFYRADLQAIEAAARAVGLLPTQQQERESWQVLTVEKPVN